MSVNKNSHELFWKDPPRGFQWRRYGALCWPVNLFFDFSVRYLKSLTIIVIIESIFIRVQSIFLNEKKSALFYRLIQISTRNNGVCLSPS